MNTWIKVCGITCLADALRAVELGADALGFVFHTASPRRCEAHVAVRIAAAVPPAVARIGVWLDESVAAIERRAREAGIRIIQTYSANVARELLRRRWRVILAVDPQQPGWLRCALHSPVERFIIDRGRLHGLNGTPGPTAAELAALRRHAPVVLAGGLNQHNVAAALRELRPDGIDVASGVESVPGRKDAVRLRRFIAEVRQWDAMVTSVHSADGSFPRR